ncbi:MAG: hypothetical protein AB8D78_07635 [Akkermansiaceae bacterium]
MTNRDDLSKLFEAALHETEAPSRFGTPDSQKKSAPKAFSRPEKLTEELAEKPNSDQLVESAVVEEVAIEGSDSDMIDISKTGDEFVEQAVKSKDEGISAELGAILDEKVLKEKRSKKRAKLIAVGLLLCITGGTAGWVVANPERFEAMKAVAAEIKSAGDIEGMVAKYQEALDKIAVRGEQINAATASMGVDPSSADHVEDQGFDKEMREMMGEEGGATTAQRDKLFRDAFDTVEETGGLNSAAASE